MKGSGAYAEYVTVPAAELAPKPASTDHTQAAGAPMSLLTAWQFLVELGRDAQNPFQPFPHAPVPLDGKTVPWSMAQAAAWDIWPFRWRNGSARM